MKELTIDIIQAINRAADDFVNEPESIIKRKYFDEFLEEDYGIRTEMYEKNNIVHLKGYEIIDEDKYVNFVLKYYGN